MQSVNCHLITWSALISSITGSVVCQTLTCSPLVLHRLELEAEFHLVLTLVAHSLEVSLVSWLNGRLDMTCSLTVHFCISSLVDQLFHDHCSDEKTLECHSGCVVFSDITSIGWGYTRHCSHQLCHLDFSRVNIFLSWFTPGLVALDVSSSPCCCLLLQWTVRPCWCDASSVRCESVRLLSDTGINWVLL